MDETKEPNSFAENATDFTKCFAYPDEIFRHKRTGCTALIELMCKKKGSCPFFRTKAEYDGGIFRYGGVKKGR